MSDLDVAQHLTSVRLCRLDPEDASRGWQLCEHTALRWALDNGAVWLHTIAMTDLDLLRPATLLDPTLIGSALLVAQLREAAMVMEVAPPADGAVAHVQWHRSAGSIAVAAAGSAPFCGAALMDNFSSAQVRRSLRWPRVLCMRHKTFVHGCGLQQKCEASCGKHALALLVTSIVLFLLPTAFELCRERSCTTT